MPPLPDDYILDTYGTCDRESDCYWGKDKQGKYNGCLQVGWRGRDCLHWHPIEGELLDAIRKAHNAANVKG